MCKRPIEKNLIKKKQPNQQKLDIYWWGCTALSCNLWASWGFRYYKTQRRAKLPDPGQLLRERMVAANKDVASWPVHYTLMGTTPLPPQHSHRLLLAALGRAVIRSRRRVYCGSFETKPIAISSNSLSTVTLLKDISKISASDWDFPQLDQQGIFNLFSVFWICKSFL